MIRAEDAIRTARSLIGTPYKELDCIGLIVRVIRTSPGGVPAYRTAGTNTLWRSAEASAKYRDLTSRQEDIIGARAGMLAFKRSGADVHHVGIVTGEGTVIHSSSARGKVVETVLDSSWKLLGVHRYIEVDDYIDLPVGDDDGKGGTSVEVYKMRVRLEDEDSTLSVRNEPGRDGDRIGRLHHGAVVTVQAEFDNGWRFISYGDGTTGYVDGRYLEAVPEEQEAKAPEITILDSAGNTFKPVGDFQVLIGGVD